MILTSSPMISALKVSFLVETLKNYNAKAGVREALLSVNAILSITSVTMKIFGVSAWNFFRASTKKARFL